MIAAVHKVGPPRKIEEYPSIGIRYDGLVVFFWGKGNGVTLTPYLDDPAGFTSTKWEMDDFFLMDGEITLKNQ